MPPKKNSGKKISFERKTLANGKPNPKYVDLLDEDKPIAGQKFFCASFCSPEQILKDKQHFYFEEFVKQWEWTKSMEKFVQFMNFISFKYSFSFEDASVDLKDFVKEETDQLRKYTIEDDFKNFMDKNEEELQNRFDVAHEFQTNVRGVKISGTFPTQEEAELRCKLLREINPNHDIFVGPVGLWVPVDIEAYKVGQVEYLEEELNQLMKEKTKNEAKAKTEFEYRVKEAKQKAIEENMKKAEKTGNLLTQTIDENGNLIGLNANTQETVLNQKEVVSSSEVCQELFEGENIVVGNTDNGKSQLVSGPFAKGT